MVELCWRRRQGAALMVLLVGLQPARAAATDIEVFHYLASRADAQRVAVLREAVQSSGYGWRDFAVAYGWTGRSESILRFRVEADNPPSAAMMKTPFMRHWAASGALVPLDEVAAAQRWDQVLPKPVADAVKYQGRYFAVPLNIHRINRLWINKRILKQSGAAVPTNWDEFFAAAEAMKRAGYAAVAYYGRGTQNLLWFEMVALGVGGPDFYRKALVDYDPAALASPVMEQVLRTYKRIKQYVEQPDNVKVSMEQGMSRFETGQVGMHLMGDWANPAFYESDKAPFDSLCVAAPGSGRHFLYTADAIAMFRSRDGAIRKGQLAFASALLSPALQHDYNLRKGAAPARQDVGLDGYHDCARKTAAEFRAAAKAHALVPALSLTATRAVEEGVQAVVTEFWNDDRMAPQVAMGRLLAATRRPGP